MLMATSTFTVPPRPPALPISQTFVFKTISETNTNIHIDLYLPPSTSSQTPIVLYVHGGGWTGSNRSDYSRPLFQSFLDNGFMIASMDYRLVPESGHAEQLEDVRDVEGWLRGAVLDGVLGQSTAESNRKIVVVGASAGGQLALLTSKLWKQAPTAMLILYASTNMHSLPYSGRGRLSALTIPPASHELLSAATDFETRPSEKALPKSSLDYLAPRIVMSTHVFREEIVVEVLLRGLRAAGEEDDEAVRSVTETGYGAKGKWGDARELKLPRRGCVPVEEVDEISPLHVLLSRPFSPSAFTHPATYLITGTKDEMFSPEDHTLAYYDELVRQGVRAEVDLVPGVGHAFDIWTEVGSPLAVQVLEPAVKWIKGVVDG